MLSIGIKLSLDDFALAVKSNDVEVNFTGFGVSRCGIRYQILDLEDSCFQAKRRSLSNNIVMQWNAKLDNGRVLAIQFLGGSSQAIPVTYFVLAMAIMGLSLASFWGNGYRLRDLMSLLAPQTVHAVQEAQ
ncbi:hypothetical protein PVK06_026274 [Gossypium arboreum]|uniref:Uncharacterized protein n=1 Tax=Gossypium arboreum TaxID=29729 RepID=A0ABR0NZP5_GOSAR|nr:hypothetical protein PVK06_026274 [Gossypium arboreum]